MTSEEIDRDDYSEVDKAFPDLPDQIREQIQLFRMSSYLEGWNAAARASGAITWPTR